MPKKPEPSSPFRTIFLPDISDRREILFNKRKYWYDQLNTNPGADVRIQLMAKIQLADSLLHDLKVEPYDVLVELLETGHYDFNMKNFYDACTIVRDYAETGGKFHATGSPVAAA
jgi:hypothetical protein